MNFLITLTGILFTVSIYLSLHDGAVANLTSNQSFFVFAITLSILASATYLAFIKLFRQKKIIIESTSALSVAFGAFVFPLLYLDVTFGPKDFLISLIAVAFTIILFFIKKFIFSKILIAFLLASSVVLLTKSSGLFSDPSNDKLADNQSVKYVFSALHDIKVTSSSLLDTVSQDGGAIAYVSDADLILVTGDGEVLHHTLEGRESPSVLARIEFGLDTYKANAQTPNRWYRITDAHLDRDNSELFITYTKWHKGDNCYTVNLDSYDFSYKDLSIKGQSKPIFESSPCINHSLLNNETGGRILRKDNDTMIFTIGSFKAAEKLSLNTYQDSDYGKVLQYSHSTNEVTPFTRGHRNAQGLAECKGNIYLTEHGPYGGDELNLLTEGSDYGWPESSFGTDYGKKVLTLSGESGQHFKGQKPIYAWTPSIGISNLICYRGDEFPNWENDLLVASLNGLGSGYSIYRTRLAGGRAVSIERIELGFKIRDLAQLDDGRVLVWDGLNTVSILSPATSEFASCAGCHNIRYRSHGIGPDLHGVVGAPIARHTDRYSYSDALKGLSGTWTEGRLHSFLENPQKFAPGTTMDIQGIEDYEQRQKIIDYLKGVSSNR